MVDIIKTINGYSNYEHSYEKPINSFEQELISDFAKKVSNWFSDLNASYRNALIALNFDPSITTSMMFFAQQSTFPFDYDQLMCKIIAFLTSKEIVEAVENKKYVDTPANLHYIPYTCDLLKKCRERVQSKNDATLSMLSPELKHMVMCELLKKDDEYQYHSKILVKSLTEYRKKILHIAVSKVIDEIKKEG